MKTTLLIGPPGSGKTTMAGLTTPHVPVHFIDVDRKLASMVNMRNALATGGVTYWELEDPLTEEPLDQRLINMVNNRKPTRAPQGWVSFAKMVGQLQRDPVAKAAKTIVVDSITRLGDHLKRQILYLDPIGNSTMSQRDWGSYLGMFEETISILIDVTRAQGQDLVITVHERVSEVPGPNTKIVRTATGKPGESTRDFLGTMQIKMAPSIEGQFGLRVASFFEEVYRLAADDSGFKCYTAPDGRYDLRTSFALKSSVHEPSFRKIWNANGK